MMLTVMKIMSTIQTWLFRLSGGRIANTALAGGDVLLLTTTGRKTGKKRTSPLVYIPYQGGYLVTGSKAGMDTHPGWYWNLRSDPNAIVEIGRNTLPIEAEIFAEGETRDELWERFLGVADYYSEHARKTERIIPVIWLKPVQT